MEFAVIANDCPKGILTGLLLARAAGKYVKKVYLLIGGKDFELVLTKKWSLSLVEQNEVVPLDVNTLSILPFGTTKPEHLNMLRQCHTFIVCMYSRPKSLEKVGSWINDSFKSDICVMCMETAYHGRCDSLLKKLDDKRRSEYSLIGCVGFQASVDLKQSDKEINVGMSSLGSFILERITRQKKHLDPYVRIFEVVGVDVSYAHQQQRENWFYGDVLWKTLDVFALLQAYEKEWKSMSLYDQLLSSKKYRLACATILGEAYQSLSGENVNLLGHESSPFGLSVPMSIYLLRLPELYFHPLLNVALFLGSLGRTHNVSGNQFMETNLGQCESNLKIILQRARGNNVSLPLISNLYALIQQRSAAETKVDDSQHLDLDQFELKKLLPFSVVTLVLSSIPFLIYYLGVFIVHAFNILFYT